MNAIPLNTNGQIWVTSDLHFSHDNVIEYCNRPTTPDEHNEWIINQLNNTIGKNDIVIHLGDFMLSRYDRLNRIKEIMKKLNGTWYFIMGNHDNPSDFINLSNTTKHKFLGSYYELRYVNDDLKVKVNFMHFPIENWNQMRYGSLMLHGHTHGKSTSRVNRFDCGLDAHPQHKPFNLLDLVKTSDKQFYKESY